MLPHYNFIAKLVRAVTIGDKRALSRTQSGRTTRRSSPTHEALRIREGTPEDLNAGKL